MVDSDSELSERELFRLKDTLRDSSASFLQRLAEEYDVDMPFEVSDVVNMVDVFVDGVSFEAKKKILAMYGDAGRRSTYIYVSKGRTPSIQEVYGKSKALLEIKSESQMLHNYPYYDEVDIDPETRTLRIRFHYLKGIISTMDKNGKRKEHYLYRSGIVVFRPESRILEIRAKHKSMTEKMAIRIPVHLELEPFVSFNLREKKLIKIFVDWISSLNSATIELPLPDVTSSLRITARRGMDLRTAEKFNEELKHGRLRGGHVTIQLDEKHKINFRIHFRDCHITYTLFTSEEEIGYVLDAIEKIAEGYKFATPNKILQDFFEKEN